MKATKNYAFTLIELIVVIIIIGILASVAVPAYNSYVQNSKEKSNENLEKTINQLIDYHLLQGGRVMTNRDTRLTELINARNQEINNNTESYNSSYWTGNDYPMQQLILNNLKTVPVKSFCSNSSQDTINNNKNAIQYQGQTWSEASANGLQWVCLTCMGISYGSESVQIDSSTAGNC